MKLLQLELCGLHSSRDNLLMEASKSTIKKSILFLFFEWTETTGDSHKGLWLCLEYQPGIWLPFSHSVKQVMIFQGRS